MTVKEAAAVIGVSLSLMYKIIEEGRVPHRRVGQRGRRGKIILTSEDVKQFLESSKVEVE